MGTKSTGSPFNAGLEAAAKYLDGTADDYEQMAARSRDLTPASKMTPSQRIDYKVYSSSATLLRGQAHHIRDIKQG